MRQTVGRNLGYAITTDQHGSQDIPESMGLSVESVISDVIVCDAGSERGTHAPHGGSFGESDLGPVQKKNVCQGRRIGRFP
jgi:hypothetical protein